MARRSNLRPCPRCGSTKRRKILYGLYAGPPIGVKEDSYVLGGCVIYFGHPTHECNDCEMRYIADPRDDLEFDERLPDDSPVPGEQ